MAHKSKTQRAKASAARAARKAAREEVENQAGEVVEAAEESSEKPSRSLFKKKSSEENASPSAKASEKKAVEKKEAKPKKKRFQFFRDVKAEMKRVTWPTKQDVLRWSGVVVVALLFFGLYTAVLDNAIVTPILVAISGLGA